MHQRRLSAGQIAVICTSSAPLARIANVMVVHRQSEAKCRSAIEMATPGDVTIGR